MSGPGAFSRDVLRVDAAREAARLEAMIRDSVFGRLRRRGAVIGLSGGIDSSVVAALSARALGPDRVFGLFMPERESSSEGLRRGRLLAGHLGIRAETEEITPILEAAGCYARRDAAVRRLIPGFGPGWRCKLAISDVFVGGPYPFFRVIALSPSGEEVSARLAAESAPELVAAMNFKQRTRTMMQYHHADRLGYAVVGGSNRLEHDQGFFVKLGDGSADVQPVIHLYKSQIFHLAAHLDVPREIREAAPSTDTFPLAQTQQEFFFSLPHETVDLALCARDRGVAPGEAAGVLGLTAVQVERLYQVIDSRRRAAAYLRAEPLRAD